MLHYFCHELDGLVYKVHQTEEETFVVKIKKDGVTVFVYESKESLALSILKAQFKYKQAVRMLEM